LEVLSLEPEDQPIEAGAPPAASTSEFEEGAGEGMAEGVVEEARGLSSSMLSSLSSSR